MKKILFILAIGAGLLITGCTKEGAMGEKGPAGTNGTNGTDGTNGVDANANCTQCHAKDVVELVATQYELSKHSYGEAAFEEAGNTTCTPCHASEAFKYVCANNTPATFTLNATTGKYVNDYQTTPDKAYGEITCSTCHTSLHTNYTIADLLPLTTTAAVPMSMWAGGKTINLTQKGGESNLCIKCHQPRPLLASAADGNVLDYVAIAGNPTGSFYDPTVTTNKLKPGYRTHVHYGAVGAVVAGMGGVEFAGILAYTSSAHTTLASCQDCHMAPISGRAGGHSFTAKGNFNGCGGEGCHSSAITSTSTTFWATPRAEIKGLLETLAAKLNVGGIDILNRNPDTEANLWAGLTSNKYDGYLNIYDPINNPNGQANNPTGIFQNPTTSGSWTQAQKDLNATFPKITLTNAQMGSIINFQLCLREYSLGIHNFNYSKALLQNSIDKL
jgi:hypothetical protein